MAQIPLPAGWGGGNSRLDWGASNRAASAGAGLPVSAANCVHSIKTSPMQVVITFEKVEFTEEFRTQWMAFFSGLPIV